MFLAPSLTVAGHRRPSTTASLIRARVTLKPSNRNVECHRWAVPLLNVMAIYCKTCSAWMEKLGRRRFLCQNSGCVAVWIWQNQTHVKDYLFIFCVFTCASGRHFPFSSLYTCLAHFNNFLNLFVAIYWPCVVCFVSTHLCYVFCGSCSITY